MERSPYLLDRDKDLESVKRGAAKIETNLATTATSRAIEIPLMVQHFKEEVVDERSV